ncbi:MAG TPA: PD-(D/E)XK nuclease family protein, partial [Anaeromyxobacteraceae bacterium]|nr:PD-(D/E)XK nuclease family protein [Anaeromyxobacteraceae bacterium]
AVRATGLAGGAAVAGGESPAGSEPSSDGPATRLSGGTARAAARLLAELREAEVSPADLRMAATGASGRARDRLEAAAAALEVYESRLASRHALDAASALRAAADAAARGAAPDEVRDLGLLVLEGLLPTSRAALDLGSALAARARRVLARIPFLPGEPDASAPAVPWLRRVEALDAAEARGAVELRFAAAGALPRGRAVRLPAPTEEAQLEAAARLAGRLVDEGMAAEDIAILAPRRLLAELRAPFERAGVPLSTPATTTLDSLPPVRDLRAALAAAGGLDRTGLLALLESPYLASGDPIPHLRLLLDRAGVLDGRGDPAARLHTRAEVLTGAGFAGWERPGLRRAAGAVRDLRRMLGTLDGPETPAGWVSRIRSFVERSGMRRRAAEGEAPLVRRDVAALSRVEDAADELASALGALGRGGERIERAEWAALLDVALGRVEVPSGQGPAAGAVEAWPIEESPGLDVRAAIVLAADRGAWPSPPRVDPVLGNAARERLGDALGRRALPTAFHDRADAEFRGLSALAAGRELLAVAWTATEADQGPAPLAARVLDLGAAEVLPLAADPPLDLARSGPEALRAAARLARGGRGDDAVRALAAEPPLADRAADAAARGAAEAGRREAWVAGRSAPTNGLVPEGLEAWRDALPAEWSATELETFAACPFRYLLRTAGVREPASGALDMEPRDEGALLHAVLEVLVRSLRDGGDWPPRDRAGATEEARRIAGEVFARFEEEGRLGDPATWAARRQSVLARLDRFVDAEAEGDPSLRPVLLEHAFGGRSGRPPLAIPSGSGDVLVQGRMDRVDADGGRLVVVDYKNARSPERSRRALALDALGVTSFQAPLYVLAAARELPGRERLEATFALLRSGERVGPWSVHAGDPFLALDPARRAEVRAAGGRTLADGVVAAVARIRAGDLPPVAEDCTGCPYGAACRLARPGEA